MRQHAGNLFTLLAVVLFLLLGLLWVVSEPTDPPDADTVWALLSFGLASFALGQLTSSYWVDR